MKPLLTVLFLSFVLTSNAQDVPEKYHDLQARINEAPGKSVDKELAKLRKSEPDDPWVFWLSGLNCRSVVLKGGKVIYDEQANFYRKAIAIDSTFFPAYYNLGLLHFDYNPDSLNAAIGLFSKTIQYNPNHCYAYLDRGKAYLKLANYDAAYADYKAAAACPSLYKWGIDQLLVEILHAQGRTEEVYEAVRQASFIENFGFEDEDFLLVLGSIYTEMGEPENACACYRHIEEMYQMIDAEISAEVEEKLAGCKEN